MPICFERLPWRGQDRAPVDVGAVMSMLSWWEVTNADLFMSWV
jgi:hypothetical protein